jgi:hypothetical protein
VNGCCNGGDHFRWLLILLKRADLYHTFAFATVIVLSMAEVGEK